MTAEDKRYVCTADAPWTPDRGRSLHPAATYLGDRDHGDQLCAVYRCPICGLRFHVEVPQ